MEHVGKQESAHNYARRQCEALKNKKQSVSYMLSNQSLDQQSSYRTRLTSILDCIRFLLGQGLSFRGHDESQGSINKGNFLELLEWYAFRKKKVRAVVMGNAPRNNQMTAPSI